MMGWEQELGKFVLLLTVLFFAAVVAFVTAPLLQFSSKIAVKFKPRYLQAYKQRYGPPF